MQERGGEPIDLLLRSPLRTISSVPSSCSLLSLEIGAQARNAKREAVRRLLLGRTGYHLYYQVNAAVGRIEILALWHSHRGREPSV